jgi:hypothetical protein
MAHPGHELLLHDWLRRARPVVFALTDGSGGRGGDRRAASELTIRAAGAEVGPVFGLIPDRSWYAAILAGDQRLFERAARLIAAACIERHVTALVSDPVEFFNPVHDLCNAVAQKVSASIETRSNALVEHFDYVIERPDIKRGAPAWSAVLDEAAMARKLAATQGYEELAGELDRFHRTGWRTFFGTERLFQVDRDATWPEIPPEEPFYERFGRERVADGTYRQLITYRRHVRPLVRMLTQPSESLSQERER